MGIAVIVGAIVALVASYAITYHGIVSKDTRCETVWQAIDGQLRRRNELICDLVETMRDAHPEPQALMEVTSARTSVADATTPAAKMAASSELSDALERLLASSQSCRQLEGNDEFKRLQMDLADAESKISRARTSFNDCVLAYNTSISTFPGSVVANAKFRRRQNLGAMDLTARETPGVES